MSDSSYSVEIRPASKNGYFTPAESNAYYSAKYARSGYCVHWWGGGETADKHDSIANYMLQQAQAGNKSVNYVLSDNKITLEVSPDNVAWCQTAGNPTDISVETQPTLGDEGYKKHGWLKDQLDQRYNTKLVIHPHNYWAQTSCPGTISLDRIAQETDKWARGVYDQPANPTPVAPPISVPVPPAAVLTTLPNVVTKFTLANAKLLNVKDLSIVKQYALDTPMEIAGKVTYNNFEFWVTKYALDHNTSQGFLVGDLKDNVTPAPAPVPDPSRPEWVKNLRDIDDTSYWLKNDQALVDITTGHPTATIMKKDGTFVASALTIANGVEYRITQYSFAKGIYVGVPIDSLTLTEPGVPDIDPISSIEKLELRVDGLEKTTAHIQDFLSSMFVNYKKL